MAYIGRAITLILKKRVQENKNRKFFIFAVVIKCVNIKKIRT